MELFHLKFILSLFCLFIVSESECRLNASGEGYHFTEQQSLVESSLQLQPEDSCPLWFYYDSDTDPCHCFDYYAGYCYGNKAYLLSGFCATYDKETDIISLSMCPYRGFTYHEIKTDWYLELPDNISLLNDYMCEPLNREGILCSSCKKGYGHTLTSIGFQDFECHKCRGVWFGVLLYICLEFFPITVFYLLILIFQVNITSAPMTCYIMWSQMSVIANDLVFAGDEGHVRELLLSIRHNSEVVFTILMTVNDVWNLRFFRYLEPPFCISESLKPIHFAFLGYISVFYPLCLIAITWMCVQLHGRNFRPLVCLWRPFHRCLARMRSKWDLARDFVNAFSTFFVLSFTKVLYQTVLLLVGRKMKRIQYNDGNFIDLDYELVVGVDQSVLFGSTEHLVFLIPSLILLIMFILPTFFLICYPCQIFRLLLSKCRLDGIALNLFLEKFYGCYKNGLDGGVDMRPFAGLYFVVRGMLFLTDSFAAWLLISNNDPFFGRSVVFMITLLLIAIFRPYKKTYMSILDILLLTHLGVACHLMSSVEAFSVKRNIAVTYYVLMGFPISCFTLVLITKMLKKVTKINNICKLIFQKCNYYYGHLKFKVDHFVVRSRSHPAGDNEPLLEPVEVEGEYGTY